MSMRKSVIRLADKTIQLGARPRTLGLLLPGFTASAREPVSIAGPSLSKPYPLGDKIYLDEIGFLARLS